MSDRKICLLLACFCFLLYCRTLSFGLSYLDDYYLLIEAKPFLSDIRNFFALFFTDVFITSPVGFYRPVLNISFMADTLLNGGGWFFTHLMNIVYYAGAVCLLFALLRKMEVKALLACALSLLFAVHPAACAAVSWVPGRNDSLLALFVISSFIFFEDYRSTGGLKPLFKCSLLFAAAMFTKESAIVLPVLFFLWLLIKGFKNSKADLNFVIFFSALPLIAWAGIRALSSTGATSVSAAATFKNILYLPLILGRNIFPFDPVLFSPYELLGSKAVYFMAAAVYLAFIIRTLAAAHRNKNMEPCGRTLFGIAWFLLFILPTFAAGAGIVSGTLFFEHRSFVPLIGIIITLSDFNVPAERLAFARTAAAVFAVFLACVSFCGSSYYENRNIFWQEAVKDSPEDFSNFVRAGIFEEQRQLYGMAEYYYRKALELNPEQPLLHASLAGIARRKGDLKKAEKEMLAELKANPGYEPGIRWLEMLRGELKEK